MRQKAEDAAELNRSHGPPRGGAVRGAAVFALRLLTCLKLLYCLHDRYRLLLFLAEASAECAAA
ncbi:hypothetical protein Deipe_3303 [Deinococcus peraridilitoris DSM 19664]|uniref:Uncharacterized protein n=1 Tax=Deinococcus peraridilitoris (strain DSM 19664 / LMG 22246 / CIP 109416 / KR-200) TaxID=937777 RepID=L0A5N0_DEIPD|nr:hypothetical protein Deipe_3303 [Deinococcus peraridilitoris DSM 19664]